MTTAVGNLVVALLAARLNVFTGSGSFLFYAVLVSLRRPGAGSGCPAPRDHGLLPGGLISIFFGPC